MVTAFRFGSAGFSSFIFWMLQIVAQCVRALAHHVLGEDFDRDIVASMMDATENHGFYYRLVQVRCSGLVLFMAWFNAPSLYILRVTCYHHHMDWCMVRNNARVFLEALAFVLTLRVGSVPIWYKFASVQCCTCTCKGVCACGRQYAYMHASIHMRTHVTVHVRVLCGWVLPRAYLCAWIRVRVLPWTCLRLSAHAFAWDVKWISSTDVCYLCV